MVLPKLRCILPPSGLSTTVRQLVTFRWRLVLLCLLLLACSAIARAQVTIHVPADQPTIQAGINAANNGDTVLVAPGTYTEAIDFLGKAITVESSAGPATTIIDGIGNNCVVTFQTNEARSSVLSGFTIEQGGFLNTLLGTAGILVLNGAAPSIVGNIITNNISLGIVSVSSAPLIQNNEISYTRGEIGKNGWGSWGTGETAVGLFWQPLDTAPPLPAVVSGNTIENNLTNDLQGMYFDAGISIGQTVPGPEPPYPPYPQGIYYIIENNIVRNNGTQATSSVGGGLVLYGGGSGFEGIIAQNLIYGNSASCLGGGVAISGDIGFTYPPTYGPSYGPPLTLFVNNLIADNITPTTLGQACSSSPLFPGMPPPPAGGSQVDILIPWQLEFANNIVVGNSSVPAITIQSDPLVPLQNAIFDHNDIFNPGGPAFVGNSVEPDPTGSYGNISADPLFVDAANNDYHLQAGSPAIDTGNTSALQQIANMAPAWALTKDFDGNPRVQDATGIGYPTVDMGPYEYAGTQETGPTTILLTPAWYEPYGETELPLTAQLISPNGTPTGTVIFYVNGVSVGTAPIDSSGQATIHTPPLATLGQTALLATYAGQGDFAPAVSVEVLIFVQPDNVSLTLTSAPNPSLENQSVTFTATIVSTSNGTPTGDIQFTDNGNPLGTAAIDADGVATFTASWPAAGSHTIVATYPGSINWGGAQASVTQVVLYPPTQETLSSSLNPALRNQAVTFTATVSSTYGTPTGTIAFSDGGAALGTVTLARGVAAFTTSALAKGSHTITAAYSGDAEFPGNSASLTQVINGIPTATTVVSITPAKLYALEPATITAAVTGQGGVPTGTVTFMNGGAVMGTATLNAAGTATLAYTFPASGSQAVTATYNADANYAASASAIFAENVLINDSETSLVVTPSPVLVYHTVTLTATVSSVSASAFGVTPYGTVNFLDGAALLGSAPLNAGGVATLTYAFTQEGDQNLTAVYAGNVAFQPSQSSSQLIVVQPSPTATTVTANSNPQGLSLPVTFTATVTAPGTAAVPVGTVTFYDGANPLGTATVNATGTATLTSSSLTLGQHAITASFTNTTIYFLPSVSPAYTENIVVFQTATAVTANVNPQELGASVTFTAKVAVSPVPAGTPPAAPVGTVTFYDGVHSLGTVTLDASGTATLTTSSLAIGQQSITASFTNTAADYQPSVSPVYTESIVVFPTATTVTSNINPQEVGDPVVFTAKVAVSSVPAGITPGTPVGTVTFYDGANPLGTATLDATGTATLTTSVLAIGQHSITASYSSATVDYLSSVSPVYTETIVIALGNFTIAAAPTAQTVYTGEPTQSITVTLTPSGGFDRDVTLSCGQLPANTTCTFTQTTIPGASGVSQLVIQSTAPHQVTSTTSAHNSTWPRKTGLALATLALIFLPFRIPFRRRSSRLLRMLSAFLLVAVLAGITGCGAPSDTGGTPPGVYNISINATFSGYGATLTHSAQFSLTVKSLF